MTTSFYPAVAAMLLSTAVYAQNDNSALQTAITKLDKAVSPKEYEQLAGDFDRIAATQSNQWLPYYYAAYCNAKAGWLYQEDPDKIEPLANKAEALIKKAGALADTSKDKKALSEIYCVQSILNRARVFINPMTYGRQYGPASSQYTQLALKADPGNPRAYYLAGWEKYATPKAWGGDKKQAKELLTKALQQFDHPANTGQYPHWGRQETTALLKQL